MARREQAFRTMANGLEEMLNNLTLRETLKQRYLDDNQLLAAEGVLSLLSCFVSVLGCLGNLVNVRVFASMGLKDGVVISLLGLSCFDLLYLSTVISRDVSFLFLAIERLNGYSVWFPIQPYSVYIFSSNLARIPYVMSFLTTTFLAMARCAVVAFPLRCRHLLSPKLSAISILLIFLTSTLTYVPVLLFMGILPQFDETIHTVRPSLWISPMRNIVKDIVWGLRDAFLPNITQLIVFVCVVIMAKHLHRAVQFRTQNTLSHRKHSKKQPLVNMLSLQNTLRKVQDTHNPLGKTSDLQFRLGNMQVQHQRQGVELNVQTTLSSMSDQQNRLDNKSAPLNTRYQRSPDIEPVVTNLISKRTDIQNTLVNKPDIRKPQGSEMDLQNNLGDNMNLQVTRPRPNNEENETSTSRELKVIQQVVLISVVYIICNTPTILINFTGLLVPDFYIETDYRNLYLTVTGSKHLLQAVHCSINLIIYFHYNSKFRQILLH